ncbi:MAG: hypothetical protein FWE67_04495 [Planctomycetaceae bacterium]|nr:hypothetical protein [Planctomycetaceae bacterium]
MTKFDWNNFPVIPDFDALQTKADIQAEILRETEGMTGEEVREFFRQAAERAVQRKTEKQTLLEPMATSAISMSPAK